MTSTDSSASTKREEPPDLPVQALRGGSKAWRQISIAALLGTVLGVALSLSSPVNPGYAALLAWDVFAVVYVAWLWLGSWRLTPEGTAEAAVDENPSRAIADAVLLVAAVASLVAVAFTLADASNAHGVGKVLRVALGIFSVVDSWFLVHTLFSVKYARRYYDGDDGGIEFNMTHSPVWSDFAYLSFTIGMTFQVSDTDLQTSALRRVALRHMLISYLFGAVIIAVTINLIAGLSK